MDDFTIDLFIDGEGRNARLVVALISPDGERVIDRASIRIGVLKDAIEGVDAE